MKKINLKNIVWKEGKHFIAQCLNVDVSSFGKSKKEAISNLDEALALYFEDSNKLELSEVTRPEIVGVSLRYA